MARRGRQRGPVTLAGHRFQACAVQDLDLAARIADHLRLLHGAGGDGDGAALHAQHVGQQFVGQVEVVGVGPVVGHQQPARKPRLHFMETGAGGGAGL